METYYRTIGEIESRRFSIKKEGKYEGKGCDNVIAKTTSDYSPPLRTVSVPVGPPSTSRNSPLRHRQTSRETSRGSTPVQGGD